MRRRGLQLREFLRHFQLSWEELAQSLFWNDPEAFWEDDIPLNEFLFQIPWQQMLRRDAFHLHEVVLEGAELHLHWGTRTFCIGPEGMNVDSYPRSILPPHIHAQALAARGTLHVYDVGSLPRIRGRFLGYLGNRIFVQAFESFFEEDEQGESVPERWCLCVILGGVGIGWEELRRRLQSEI